MTSYVLKINTEPEHYSKISNILGVSPTNRKAFWEFSIDEDNDLYTNSINWFMDLIELNFKNLKNLGIKKEQISLWFYKPYQGECSMEFSPEEMKRLSDNNITLCISCWEL
ncbi:MAG: hypothetical protein ACK5MD_03630 [Flavobacteriales bacterium]